MKEELHGVKVKFLVSKYLLRAIGRAPILILLKRLGYLCAGIPAKFWIRGFRYVGNNFNLSSCNLTVNGRQYIPHCIQMLSLSVLCKCLIMSNSTLFIQGSFH